MEFGKEISGVKIMLFCLPVNILMCGMPATWAAVCLDFIKTEAESGNGTTNCQYTG